MTRALQGALLSFPLPPGSLPVSAFPLPSPALAGSFVGMSAGPPRVSALLFPPRFSPVSFPLPCVQFFSTFVPRGSASGSFRLPFVRFSPPSPMHSRSGWLARLRFPRLRVAVVFSPAFPSASFPFLEVSSLSLRPVHFPFVQFSPLRFDRISPDPSARFDRPRIPCGFRFYHPEFGVRFCGPRVAPERAPHHSPRAAT
jgi:hypothetical protein